MNAHLKPSFPAAGTVDPRDSRVSHFAARPTSPHRHSAGYSRFVTMMKLALAAIAVALVVLVAVWPQLQVEDGRFRIGFAAFRIGNKDGSSVVNARFVATHAANQPYSVTADLVKNVTKDSASVELEMPKADIVLEDGSWLVLTAEAGSYDRTSEKLDLTGAVNVFHDSGYELRTTGAQADLNRRIAVGDQPVEGQGPFGELTAEGFHLDVKSKVILFTGKAQLVFFPSGGGTAP